MEFFFERKRDATKDQDEGEETHRHKRSDTEAVVKEEGRHTGTRATARSTMQTIKRAQRDENRKVATLYVKDPATYIYICMLHDK